MHMCVCIYSYIYMYTLFVLIVVSFLDIRFMILGSKSPRYNKTSIWSDGQYLWFILIHFILNLYRLYASLQGMIRSGFSKRRLPRFCRPSFSCSNLICISLCTRLVTQWWTSTRVIVFPIRRPISIKALLNLVLCKSISVHLNFVGLFFGSCIFFITS